MYYVSGDGNFLIFFTIARQRSEELSDGLKTTVGRTGFPRKKMRFQAIQFQSGFLVVDQSIGANTIAIKEIVRYLKRQLRQILLWVLGGRHVSYKYIFNIAVGISVFCLLLYCIIVAYTVIYRRVNKTFKAVDHD